jgi:DNA (cytosine-5)-methyltransferase 1
MRKPEVRVFGGGLVIDSFACGGGTSTGIEMALGRSPDIAINHDPRAISMHQANHLGTKHYISNVWDVDPLEATQGREVDLFWLSPDCTFHSKARGGRPHRDRNRARRVRGLPWLAYRWAKALGDRKPKVIVMENVEEIADWGPMGSDGKPCPLRKGFTFRRFVAMLSNIGYRVDWRLLVAADYGAPTTRKRLFLIARADGLPIVWPMPTHAKGGKGGLTPWRTAAECIDFSDPGKSIFGRARPLAVNTEKRIARGLWRFVINDPNPFIIPVSHTGDNGSRVHSIDEPLRTVTTGSGPAHAIVTPFLTEHANASSPRVFPANEPLRTQCAKVKGGHFALVAPTLIQTGYGERKGQAPRVPGVDKPLGTVVAGGAKHALVSAFLAKHYGGHEATGTRMGQPVDTITTQDHHSLVTSHLVKLRGTCRDGQRSDAPVPTLSAQGTHVGEVRAFLTRYNGSSTGQRLNDPASTIDTTDRLGLVTVKGWDYVIADVLLRMLKPRELFNAHGFPPTYIIDRDGDGKPFTQREQVSMVGNSVPPPVAAAIVHANLVLPAQQREFALAGD